MGFIHKTAATHTWHRNISAINQIYAYSFILGVEEMPSTVKMGLPACGQHRDAYINLHAVYALFLIN